MSWYSKGLHNGGHLERHINAADSICQARDIIGEFFSNADLSWRSNENNRQIAIAAAMSTLGMSMACSCAPSQEQVQANYDKKTGKLSQLTVMSKDGKPNITSYMDGTKFLRIEIDTNEDGKIDRWEYYGADQKLERVGFSRANDGIADAWAFQRPTDP